MNRVDNILADYDKNLEKAKTGECKKVTQSTEFRYSFRRKYREEYETELEEIKKKLLSKNHAARVGEKSSEEVFYGFTLAIVPRHLLSSQQTGIILVLYGQLFRSLLMNILEQLMLRLP